MSFSANESISSKISGATQCILSSENTYPTSGEWFFDLSSSGRSATIMTYLL